MAIEKIALRIYGGGTDIGSNPQPLMSVGEVPNGFSPIFPTLVDEQQAWIIIHAQNYTLYAVSSKRCYTVDEQLGQMLFFLFLPPQKRLADGISPLAVLDEMAELFTVQGLLGGKLPNKPIDNAHFKSALAKYNLEDRPVQLPIMQGQNSASFCVNGRNQLDALMRHSRYDVLSTVGCLELGYNCKSTISLMTSAKKTKEKEYHQSHQNSTNSKENAAVNNVSSNTGGLPLDDVPVEIRSNSWGKKLLKIAIWIVSIFLGLFIALVVGMFLDDSDNSQNTETVKKRGFIDDQMDQDESATFPERIQQPLKDETVLNEQEATVADLENEMSIESELERRAKKTNERAEILHLVNQGNWHKLRSAEGYNSLSKKEKIAIESILRPEFITHNRVSATTRRKIKHMLRGRNYKSFEEIFATLNEIHHIINEDQIDYER